MNIIVVGMGRMGTSLAHKLDRQGYDVCAIDQEPERLEALRESFGGRTVEPFSPGSITKTFASPMSRSRDSLWVLISTCRDEARFLRSRNTRSIIRGMWVTTASLTMPPESAVAIS